MIRGLRVQSLINEEFGFLDVNKKKADFLAYFKTKAEKKDQKWMKVYLHFYKFVNGKCSFGDVTVELCNKFRDYLLNAHHLKRKNQKISQNSAAGYFSTFRALLKIAYKEKFFRENLNNFLDSIETTDVKIEYLTLEEVKKLVETPCKIPVLKEASLFSCLTGLRISDILNLEWKNIVPASEGGYCMRIKTEKTETEATLPISDEALKLCGERNDEKVFKGLKRFMVYQPLKNWVQDAGITKHITFHCFRYPNFYKIQTFPDSCYISAIYFKESLDFIAAFRQGRITLKESFPYLSTSLVFSALFHLQAWQGLLTPALL